MRYTVTVPYIPSMGSVSPFVVSDSPMESKRENALWTLNNMREHDGLKPLLALPRGTTFTPFPR